MWTQADHGVLRHFFLSRNGLGLLVSGAKYLNYGNLWPGSLGQRAGVTREQAIQVVIRTRDPSRIVLDINTEKMQADSSTAETYPKSCPIMVLWEGVETHAFIYKDLYDNLASRHRGASNHPILRFCLFIHGVLLVETFGCCWNSAAFLRPINKHGKIFLINVCHMCPVGVHTKALCWGHGAEKMFNMLMDTHWVTGFNEIVVEITTHNLNIMTWLYPVLRYEQTHHSILCSSCTSPDPSDFRSLGEAKMKFHTALYFCSI